MIVVDRASAVIEIKCINELGVNVVPLTMKWSLYNEAGTIVNARENVIISPALTMYIALNGDDVAYVEGDETRKVLIEGTYLSAQGTLNVKKTVTLTVSRE